MARYELQGSWYTPRELSELSGIPAHTIRDRLRRGYSVEEAIKVVATKDSVKEFGAASFWEDWVNKSTREVYTIYWKWCINNGYQPSSNQGFSRQLLAMYPHLKTVPTKRADGCYRIIRLRGV